MYLFERKKLKSSFESQKKMKIRKTNGNLFEIVQNSENSWFEKMEIRLENKNWCKKIQIRLKNENWFEKIQIL